MIKSVLTWGDTPAEQQLLIWPMVSVIARDANAVAKIGIIRNNVDAILQRASQTSVVTSGQVSDRSMLDLLQGAYERKEAGKWSLYGEEIQAVRDYVDMMLKQIQFPDKKSVPMTPAANEDAMKIAA